MRDAGSALVELVVVGLVMLLPLLHLVVVVSRVQAGAFAVDAAARAAARAAASAPDPASGAVRAHASVLLALRDQGFDVDPREAAAAVRMDCESDPCGAPGTLIEVVVDYAVPLPGLAGLSGLLGGVVPATVPVTGESAAVVDRFAVRTPVP